VRITLYRFFECLLKRTLHCSAFVTVKPENLWTAIQKQVPSVDIIRIMEPWTTQAGYPYITVNVINSTVTITQNRFLIKSPNNNLNTMWPIPLTYSTQPEHFLNTSPQQIFFPEDGSTKTIILPETPVNYFIVNNQQTGYYRVNYDAENWMKIKEALSTLNHGGIHVLNRAQIVDDLFNFARSGLISYSIALEIIDYIKTEKHYIPWMSTFNGLSYITKRLTGADEVILLQHHVLDILEDIYEKLGFFPKSGDTHTEIYNRNNVLSWLCRYNHEECLQNVREEFKKFSEQPLTYQ
jgi:aminopeptidase N